MKDIFDMQMKLNVHTLSRIGLDFHRTMEDPEQKCLWIENYRKALSSEVAELVREVQEHGPDTHNGKVEVVDILHFLVSLSQIVGIQPQEVVFGPGEVPSAPFPQVVVRTFLALDDLQNSVKWKWWAEGGGFKPEKARGALMELWRCFECFRVLCAMDSDSVKRIYVEKNRINFMRQAAAYNEDTKTEEDVEAMGL